MIDLREYIVEQIEYNRKQEEKEEWAIDKEFHTGVIQGLEQALVKLDEAIKKIDDLPNESVEPVPDCVRRSQVLEILRGKQE